jgi:predicted acylesterase/phospholipase RssA
MPDDSDKQTFRLGLTMAGAISAGAYTGGVVDFLIEALDEWEKARVDPAVPSHKVTIPVMSGASAGAITSAIAAVALNSQTTPVLDVDKPPPESANRLYDAWVRQVDLSKLLRSDDLGDGRPVVSLLDSTILDSIAKSALDAPKRSVPRAYVADPLAVFLTVANLRGVPYGFELFGGDDKFVYGMLRHMDDMRFAVSRTKAELPWARTLDPAKAPGDNWPHLADAALASSAFPIGLRPRALSRPHADYDGRLTVESGDQWLDINPRWSSPADPFDFLNVDGGLINNEPLELARQHLAGGPGKLNPRKGEAADRAVIMIDPFPNVLAADLKADTDARVVKVAMKMFGALVNQARFRPEDLATAARGDVYSRFAIMPSRRNSAGNRAAMAMASAILGGFGGFLSEVFRRHDFYLGRRNCQAFLRWHFCLPETNDLFRGFEQRDAWYVREKDGSMQLFDSERQPGKRVPYLPIIPLCGTIAADAGRRPFPRASDADSARLRKAVAARVADVGDALIATELEAVTNRVIRWLIRKGWQLGLASNVTDKAMEKIEGELAMLDKPENR